MKKLLIAILALPIVNHAMESIGQEKNLVENIFTNEKSINKAIDALSPDMSHHLAQLILQETPIVALLLHNIPLPAKNLKDYIGSDSAAQIKLKFQIKLKLWSHDLNEAGDLWVVASVNNTAEIWHDKNSIATLKGHTDDVVSAQFNNTGDMIITASRDNTAKIWHWDGENATYIATLEGHNDNIMSAQFNKTGNMVLITSLDTATLWLWDGENATYTTTLEGHNDCLYDAQFNKAGDMIVTSSSYLEPGKIWDISSLLKVYHFLTKEIKFHQAILLKAIYEVVISRALVKKFGKNAFKNDQGILSSTITYLFSSYYITFDFSKYPHLLEHYTSMLTKVPELEEILAPYISRNTWWPLAS